MMCDCGVYCQDKGDSCRYATPQCRTCGGTGQVADYIGLEMKCVGVECADCKGKGFVETEFLKPSKGGEP